MTARNCEGETVLASFALRSVRAEVFCLEAGCVEPLEHEACGASHAGAAGTGRGRVRASAAPAPHPIEPEARDRRRRNRRSAKLHPRRVAIDERLLSAE